MKRFFLASLGVCVLVWGTQASASPRVMTDGQMDFVVAGSAATDSIVPEVDGGHDKHGQGSGGTIVANDSSATVKTTGEVNLSSSQQHLQAVNVVNSSESSVANGVNIWNGQISEKHTPALSKTEVKTNQANMIAQDQSRQASLMGYKRADFSKHTVNKTSDKFDQTATVTHGPASSAAGSAEIDIHKVAFAAEGAKCTAGSGGSCSATNKDEHRSFNKMKMSKSSTDIHHAQAENIVVDGSKLEAVSNNSVKLSDHAQDNVKAVNVVNAASSVVGNGVNIASTSGLTAACAAFNLNQVNVIAQRR